MDPYGILRRFREQFSLRRTHNCMLGKKEILALQTEINLLPNIYLSSPCKNTTRALEAKLKDKINEDFVRQCLV